jgi:3D (Asp-Asp-Asp) domain-containing protein
MRSLFGGSAIVAAALLSGSLILSARPSAAETLLSQFTTQTPDVQTEQSTGAVGAVISVSIPAPLGGDETAKLPQAGPAANYVATAYSLKGRTASGRTVSRGVIAADPTMLPLGSRVRLQAGAYSGEYLVADTGGAVRGRKIDIWTPSGREAMRFGKRLVKLTVLSYGPRARKRSRTRR